MSEKKWVYVFDELDQASAYVGGDWDKVRALLGGKGANLFEMTRIRLPVPPFFTVTTEACNAYTAGGSKFPAGMWDQEVAALKRVEEASGKKFGDPKNPLLVSCRSGAKFSMPGMMDTVLNIGLNDETVEGMAKLTDNPRFAYDSYRRLIQMFGSVVLGMPDEAFEEPFDAYKHDQGLQIGHRPDHRRPQGPDRLCSRRLSRMPRASTSPRTRSISSAWRPKPCSNPGWASAPLITAVRKPSPMTWAPPSIS